MDDPRAISYFAKTHGRREPRLFGIRQTDRLHHLYVVGKTGTGKSTLLGTLVQGDARAGRGFCLIDPHGDLAAQVWRYARRTGRSDLLYWNVADPASPYGYNPLRHVRADKIPLAVSGLLDALKHLWRDAWGARMEHILRNALYALFEIPDAILPDILRLLTDDGFREEIAGRVHNPAVRTFLRVELSGYTKGYRAEGIGPIQNKIGAFLANPILARILTAPEKDLHFRQMMDAGAGLIISLGKGEIGEDGANLLGSLLVSTIGLAAFSRADVRAEVRRPFYLHIDEFQTFTTHSFTAMAAELRKYGVALALANQHLSQMAPDIRHAVLGNAGTLIAFRVGPEDAAILAKEFRPAFDADDLLALPNYRMYLKLMIEGTPSVPFSASTTH